MESAESPVVEQEPQETVDNNEQGATNYVEPTVEINPPVVEETKN